MQINWTFGRKLAAGFAIAVLTLVVIGIAGYKSTAHLIENDRWVAHTHEVRTKLADLLSFLKDAETGQRGFVITGDEGFIEPPMAGRDEVERRVCHSVVQQNRARQRSSSFTLLRSRVLTARSVLLRIASGSQVRRISLQRGRSPTTDPSTVRTNPKPAKICLLARPFVAPRGQQSSATVASAIRTTSSNKSRG